ncbi:GNAT family N-acetyltransferase [Umboniibacter marinipuniceus]|uniref:Acetyltransferase (GNAT) family protein n=1 Tax=Umboniibacter marinipuniceus TaxID=569599 RepID=A0A3M0A2K5_9GAMM|nr:GNAT family N-acetyltransferase [Umboniibacter marinipuniceus]RMA78876.1 acetyltransferase (GNAT) family protein [Umboniibacter marinipuniceus]
MLKKIDPISYPLVKQFYKMTRYGGAPGRQETVWGWYEGSQLIACVRIEPKGEAHFLRAMVVHPDYRGRGIGAKFLAEVMAQYEHHAIYCFPFSHLVTFYTEGGFSLCTDEGPQWFLQQYRRLSRQRDVVAMARITSKD